MNLATLFTEQAKASPQRAALIAAGTWKPRTLSFSELETASIQAARSLLASGLRKGDTVLLLQPVSIELYIILLALFRLGLAGAFPAPSDGLKGIENCCRRLNPKGLIATASLLGLQLFLAELRHIPYKFSTGLPFPGANALRTDRADDRFETLVDCAADHPALITFTSGSSALAKGTVRSHGILIAQYRALAEAIQLKAGETDLATLPIFVLANLASGVTTLLADTDLRHPGKADGKAVLKQIELFQPTRSSASPAFFASLADACLEKNVRLDGLNKIYTGGAPVFPGLVDRLKKIAPRADIVCLYGSTEAEPIALMRYEQLAAYDQSAISAGAGLPAGYPVPQINLKILPDRWGQPIGPFSADSFVAECLSANICGEIAVSGDHVLQGYLDGQGNEENKFTVGGQIWHRTGDAGYLDNQGRLWLVGKCIGRISDDRGELYPLRVEAACRSLTDCNTAMVSHRGRRLLLLQGYSGNAAGLAEIKAKLHWAHIDAIRPIPKIPLDARHNAKIDYQALFRLLSQPGFDDD